MNDPENRECETCGTVNDATEVDYCDSCSSPLFDKENE